MPCSLISNHYERDLSCNLCFLVILYSGHNNVNKTNRPILKPSPFCTRVLLSNSKFSVLFFLLSRSIILQEKSKTFQTFFCTHPKSKVKVSTERKPISFNLILTTIHGLLCALLSPSPPLPSQPPLLHSQSFPQEKPL